MSSHHQDLLLALLMEYSNVFAQSRDELGHTDVLQHEIITDSASPTETTDSTSITESAPTTEETQVTDQMPFGMQSSMTTYPSREHRPPSRYDDYIRV